MMDLLNKYSPWLNLSNITSNVSQIMHRYVGFEDLTAVVMKSFIFWDITPCSPLSVTDVLDEHKPSKKAA
jgi:hypothetical protein